MRTLAVHNGYTLVTYECRDIAALTKLIDQQDCGFSKETEDVLATTHKEGTYHAVCNTTRALTFRKVYGFLDPENKLIALAAVDVAEDGKQCHINVPMMDAHLECADKDKALFVHVIAIRIFNTVASLWRDMPQNPVIRVSTQSERVANRDMVNLFKVHTQDLCQLRFTAPVRKPNITCLKPSEWCTA